MTTAFHYLALSGLLTVLLWVPYIGARAYEWGLVTFLKNYPDGYPQSQPPQALWAARAQRAHLNMVETMPAFIAVVVAAAFLKEGDMAAAETVGKWTQLFFYARLGHAAVYIFGIPYLRTPVYLASWVAILMIGFRVLS
ncbi:MAPEG family protein [Kordiimonas lacus]|uniref:MAPEG family protein n=1 Tax=Kordiimonas lacus TaxID=637679 RepID=A0A1G7CRD5_9PROT|nr:MAPEG family protein [Kordiimonas lacus]SDE41859.1 MAPEG family protein [Kordiimonas lacus]